MICEKCKKPTNKLLFRVPEQNDAYSWQVVPVTDVWQEDPAYELPRNAVCADLTPDWAGAGLSEEEQQETICCPYCGKYPFEETEIRTYSIIRVLYFPEK